MGQDIEWVKNCVSEKVGHSRNEFVYHHIFKLSKGS